jgi:hypothetical protein
MVLIDIKKYIVVSLLLMSTTTVIFPDATIAPSVMQKAQTAPTRYEYEMVEFDDEEGLIDANEKINPQDLIKGWAAFLARSSKYFFVVANKVYIWWYGSARRNVVRG